MEYAQIRAGKVNIIEVADATALAALQAAGLTIIDPSGYDPLPKTGWVYDAVADTFSAPESADKTITQLTVLEFRNRFTFAEKVALKSSSDVGVQVFIDDLSVATYVDLTDENLITGMDYLVSLEIITEARKAEILATV